MTSPCWWKLEMMGGGGRVDDLKGEGTCARPRGELVGLCNRGVFILSEVNEPLLVVSNVLWSKAVSRTTDPGSAPEWAERFPAGETDWVTDTMPRRSGLYEWLTASGVSLIELHGEFTALAITISMTAAPARLQQWKKVTSYSNKPSHMTTVKLWQVEIWSSDLSMPTGGNYSLVFPGWEYFTWTLWFVIVQAALQQRCKQWPKQQSWKWYRETSCGPHERSAPR